jgi:3-oxoacyl-[acyl-carrier-protein] synthase-3
MTGLPVAITGWATKVPEGRVTNADLEAQVDTNDQWIVERTGIRERRIAAPDESTATLAVDACAAAIKRAGLTPDDIDLLIVTSATPEQPLPHTGAFVGDALGLRCGSFDLQAACSGFAYSLVVGAAMVGVGYEHVLVVGSETLSRIMNPADRQTLILFGDGAGAAVLSRRAGDAPSILSWDLGCDGASAGILGIAAGGSRQPTNPDTVAAGGHYLHMQGQEVFRRAVRALVESAQTTLARANATPDDVQWFVPHQANLRIIDAVGARLGIPRERTVVNIERFGNTSTASIPLTLFEHVDNGHVRDGDLVLMSAFGAGVTWASVLLRWGSA